ncbi:MAG: hypothetical protein COB93_12240 [Sneathiella sp.]|nr:MAG: hypothetical protein COB93_12240 [Sneathiella sp.]
MKAKLRQDIPNLESGIRDIEIWLTGQMLGHMDFLSLFSELSQRIDKTLFPLLRSHVTMRQIHPFIDHTDHTWYRDQALNSNSQPRPEGERLIWVKSPLYHMVENFIPEMRYDLTRPENVNLFPIFSEFAEKGATDYIAFLFPFGDIATAKKRSDGALSSWATDKEGGFTEQDVNVLRRLVSLFSVSARLHKREQTLDDVLAAYMGPLAGQQVMDGKNQRGDGEIIQAVIWICDLRGSSSLADKMEMPDYLALLNQFFEVMANAVMNEGGEVLKFMGDGFLAIFPTSKDNAISEAAAQAVTAAQRGGEALASLKTEARKLGYGIGIHHGDVMFGNIGARERLDFSVIGPAVNKASRLQDLTKALDVRILVSKAVAEQVNIPWHKYPAQKIPGLDEPIDVLTPL